MFLRSWIKILGKMLSNAPFMSKNAHSRGVVDEFFMDVTRQNYRTV